MSLRDRLFVKRYDQSYYDSIQEEIESVNESEDGEVYFDAFLRLEFINDLLSGSFNLIDEMEFRLNHSANLLSRAKCPNDCNGKCEWCYEREVELKAQKVLFEQNESEE
jgi:hypothetical protein